MKITTLDYKEPKIRVEAWPNTAGEVKVEILEKSGNREVSSAGNFAQGEGENQSAGNTGENIAAMEILQADGKFSCEIALPEAKLWSPEETNLYV